MPTVHQNNVKLLILRLNYPSPMRISYWESTAFMSFHLAVSFRIASDASSSTRLFPHLSLSLYTQPRHQVSLLSLNTRSMLRWAPTSTAMPLQSWCILSFGQLYFRIQIQRRPFYPICSVRIR